MQLLNGIVWKKPAVQKCCGIKDKTKYGRQRKNTNW